jgi:hypothetical protein
VAGGRRLGFGWSSFGLERWRISASSSGSQGELHQSWLGPMVDRSARADNFALAGAQVCQVSPMQPLGGRQGLLSASGKLVEGSSGKSLFCRPFPWKHLCGGIAPVAVAGVSRASRGLSTREALYASLSRSTSTSKSSSFIGFENHWLFPICVYVIWTCHLLRSHRS